MGKISIRRVVSATMAVDNSADTDRKHEVSGVVKVVSGKAQNIGEGQVRRLDGAESSPASCVAVFHFYDRGQKTVTFNAAMTEAEEADVMAAINGFLADVDAMVSDIEIVANVKPAE